VLEREGTVEYLEEPNLELTWLHALDVCALAIMLVPVCVYLRSVFWLSLSLHEAALNTHTDGDHLHLCVS